MRFLSLENLRKLELLVGKRRFGVVSLELPNFYHYVSAKGVAAAFTLLDVLIGEALELFPRYFPVSKVIFIEKVSVNEFLFCFDWPNQSYLFDPTAMAAFRVSLVESLEKAGREVVGDSTQCLVGFSLLEARADDPLQKTAFKVYCEAKRYARTPLSVGHAELQRDFLALLDTKTLTCLYQPVIDLGSGESIGWEAFVRGPSESPFCQAPMLLTLALETSSVFSLEKICREQAIRRVGSLAGGKKLFVNIHPHTLKDPRHHSGETVALLAECGLTPEQVVLEFSERNGASDAGLLERTLEHYRSQGFLVAVDDVGSGASSLSCLAQLRPDFIKTDISVIQGIDNNPLKRVIVETLTALAEKLGSRVIAEGVETEAELTTLLSMGVHAAQGFHLAKPELQPQKLSILLPVTMNPSRVGGGNLKCSMPVAELTVPGFFSVPPHITVREAKKLLADKPPMGSVVVEDGQRPVGLLMNYNLDRHLSHQFGMSLYYDREVHRVMDARPLIVDAEMAVEEVAQLAMNRDAAKIYDDVIVTRSGLTKGTVSVQRLLDTLAQVQVELAKGSNPLTGLPGNVAIEQELSTRSLQRRPSALIYVDLDNFKVYNDCYGFDNGDKVILFTARVVSEVSRREGGRGAFVGHVGGDDFVVICEPDRAESVCRCIADIFEREVGQFYNEHDRACGQVRAKGRDGTETDYGLVSASMGVIYCEFLTPIVMDEMSLRVAEVKKKAKAIPGNSYFLDRRTPLGAIPMPEFD